LYRLVKRWRRYEPLEKFKKIEGRTRGLYILYRKKRPKAYEVVYIGVAGLGHGGGGVRSRLRRHRGATTKKTKKRKNWTHYSFFEVHDNITRQEIKELEAMVLAIFRDDPRVKLANRQKGSKALRRLRRDREFRESLNKSSVVAPAVL
jgi:hypothetical protein